MKVSDYEVDFTGGGALFTCCMDDIMNNNDACKEGDIIECSECGASMCLTDVGNGKLMWRGQR